MAGTEAYGPFDSQPWADQTQWYRFAPTWVPSGVIDTPAASPASGSLGLTFSGLTPTISAGRAWVRGAGYELSGGSKTMAAVAANTNASLSRRDRIVLRRDLSAKTVALTWIQGTPASTPAAPALTQVETGQWDVPLFSFLVPPNSGTTITGIIDERPWIAPAPSPNVELINGFGPVYGSLPASFIPQMQAGTASVVTNASAIGSFAWPVDFPAGVLTVQLTALTDSVTQLRVVGSGGTTTNTCQFVARKFDGTPAVSTSISVAYLAIGW